MPSTINRPADGTRVLEPTPALNNVDFSATILLVFQDHGRPLAALLVVRIRQQPMDPFASELVEDLAETSFARAMRISMGTVSVVTSLTSIAGCFGRIWCVYELRSELPAGLVDGKNKDFKYDIVTAFEGVGGWGITHGFAVLVPITDGLSCTAAGRL